MRNISKRIKGSVVAVLFLSIVTVFLFNVFGSGNFFVLASAHGANAETAAEGSALDTDVILGSSWTIYDIEENYGYYWIDDWDYGSKIEFIPPEPEREGYTFGGWYKEPECINEWDFGTDVLPEERTEINEDGEEEVVYQETKLYAKWL